MPGTVQESSQRTVLHQEETRAAVVARYTTAAPDSHDEQQPPVVLVVGPTSSRGAIWLWMQEDLDLATVESARTELASIVDDTSTSGCVLLFLGAKRFVDLGGLRMLVQTADRARRRCVTVLVVGPSMSVRLLVEHVGCTDELPMVPTAEAAMRWIRTEGPGGTADRPECLAGVPGGLSDVARE